MAKCEATFVVAARRAFSCKYCRRWTIGLIVIYLAALFICLLILALIFGSLAFLANVLGRTGATYSNMIAHAHHNGIDVVFAARRCRHRSFLLLLLGAHRFWKKTGDEIKTTSTQYRVLVVGFS